MLRLIKRVAIAPLRTMAAGNSTAEKRARPSNTPSVTEQDHSREPACIRISTSILPEASYRQVGEGGCDRCSFEHRSNTFKTHSDTVQPSDGIACRDSPTILKVVSTPLLVSLAESETTQFSTKIRGELFQLIHCLSYLLIHKAAVWVGIEHSLFPYFLVCLLAYKLMEWANVDNGLKLSITGFMFLIGATPGERQILISFVVSVLEGFLQIIK